MLWAWCVCFRLILSLYVHVWVRVWVCMCEHRCLWSERCGIPGPEMVCGSMDNMWVSLHDGWKQNFIILRGAHAQVHWTISSHDIHTFTFYYINVIVRLNEMVYLKVSDVQKAPKYQCFSLLAALKLCRSTTADAESSQCSSVSVEESSCCIASGCREVLWQTDGCW